ncbi:nuclear transport factor 2 family protein [Sphaerisporangium aureirubrum]|uniref:Nuclear transport factor 2 family protein n=1 Tax=Sphaerisporangium aureirubrum TaxID=1544736 RepID=A0ABW1NM69_9ACTN
MPTPRELFESFQVFGADEDLLAEDLVVETPFAPPGRPRRWEGRDAWLAFARPARATFPFELRRRGVVVHETPDPEVIVVEYELGGALPGTDHEAWAPFIGVLRARDGKVVHWREYQNAIAIAAATGGLPDLLASLGAGNAIDTGRRTELTG